MHNFTSLQLSLKARELLDKQLKAKGIAYCNASQPYNGALYFTATLEPDTRVPIPKIIGRKRLTNGTYEGVGLCIVATEETGDDNSDERTGALILKEIEDRVCLIRDEILATVKAGTNALPWTIEVVRGKDRGQIYVSLVVKW